MCVFKKKYLLFFLVFLGIIILLLLLFFLKVLMTPTITTTPEDVERRRALEAAKNELPPSYSSAILMELPEAPHAAAAVPHSEAPPDYSVQAPPPSAAVCAVRAVPS